MTFVVLCKTTLYEVIDNCIAEAATFASICDAKSTLQEVGNFKYIYVGS
jgi:hypothetical protein